MLYDSCIINAKSNPKYIRTITQEVILCNTNISSDAPLYCFVLWCPVLGIWTLEVAMDTPLCIGTIYIYTTMYKHYIHVHRAYMHLCVNHSMVCPRDFEAACAFTRFFFKVGAKVVWPWSPSPCDRNAFVVTLHVWLYLIVKSVVSLSQDWRWFPWITDQFGTPFILMILEYVNLAEFMKNLITKLIGKKEKSN